MVLRLDQVKFGLVRAVIIRNVLIGNVDLGRDFLVDHFVHGKRASKVAFEIVQSDLFFLQAGVEFFLGIRRPDLIQFALNVLVRGQQAELFRPPHENLVIDQLAQDAQTQAGRLLTHWLLIRARSLILIILLYVRPIDFAATNRRRYFLAAW